MRRHLVSLSFLALALFPAAHADQKVPPPSRDLDSPDRMGEREMLEQIRMRVAVGRPWIEIARLAYENPARFSEIVLPPEGPRALGEEMPADYSSAIEEAAARDEDTARGEARLWREGWLRVAADVAPQLRRKGAPGARRIALEFLKVESGGDPLGFDWREEPEAAGNRAALARWKAALSASPFAESGAYRIVVADVVKLRAAASPSAPVVARLRINTDLRVVRTEGEHVEVVVRAGGSPARGFVERRYVSDGPMLEVGSALEAARKEASAGRPLEALTWAERAFALDRSSEPASDLLEKTAREAGQPERAAFARRFRTGEVPVYFGVCAAAGTSMEHPQLIVVAKRTPEGDLSAVAPDEGAHLASEAWFVATASVPGYRSAPFSGTPTVRPRTLSYMYGQGNLLSLGEGCRPGEVWATSPVREVSRAGIDASALAARLELLRKEAFDDSVRGSALLEEVAAPNLLEGVPVASVLVRGRARWSFVYDEPEIHPASLWALFGTGGRMLRRLGGVTGGGSTYVKETLWTVPVFGPAWRIGFVRSESEAGTTANGDVLVVLVDPIGNVTSLPVRLWDGGC